MAHTRKNERRLLTGDEMEFVEKARHPVLGALSDDDLHHLVGYLSDRRARALTIANNQRRALRGKGGRGEVTFEKADSGNRQKAAVLTDALTRARREAKRPANLPRPNQGMRAKARTRVDPIGSVGEAGRVTKFVAVAQAKKDSRG